MTTPETSQIVSANDLLNGDVIYFTAAGQWSRNPEDAAVWPAGDAAAAALDRAAQSPDRAVGPYLIDLALGTSPGKPDRLREQIRRAGPTVGPLNTAPRGGHDAAYPAA